MLLKRLKGWELPERAVTPESVFHNRRTLLKGLAAGPIILSAAALAGCSDGVSAEAEAARQRASVAPDPSSHLYPVKRNPAYADGGPDRPITDPDLATSYNNFYEFGGHKNISRAAQALKIRPWTVTLDGEVAQPKTIDIDALLGQMPLEERVYRHLREVVHGRAVERTSIRTGQWRSPWPRQIYPHGNLYGPGPSQEPGAALVSVAPTEGHHRRGDERSRLHRHRPLRQAYPRQNGAPLRLVVPWKYGFRRPIYRSLHVPQTWFRSGRKCNPGVLLGECVRRFMLTG